MARIPLVRGAVDYNPRFCDQCGKQVVMGVMFSVKIGDVEYRVCTLECETALKEKHNALSQHVPKS